MMLKRPSVWVAFMVSGIIIVLFRVKYEVSALEMTQNRLKIEIAQRKEAIHVLKAEWAHLNEPKRLQVLCAKYLPHLKAIHSKQLITLQDMIKTNIPASVDQLDTYLSELFDDESPQKTAGKAQSQSDHATSHSKDSSFTFRQKKREG